MKTATPIRICTSRLRHHNGGERGGRRIERGSAVRLHTSPLPAEAASAQLSIAASLDLFGL